MSASVCSGLLAVSSRRGLRPSTPSVITNQLSAVIRWQGHRGVTRGSLAALRAGMGRVSVGSKRSAAW